MSTSPNRGRVKSRIMPNGQMESVLRESRRAEDCETKEKERGNARAAGVRRGRLQPVRREMAKSHG
jgi:hypothetical protein